MSDRMTDIKITEIEWRDERFMYWKAMAKDRRGQVCGITRITTPLMGWAFVDRNHARGELRAAIIAADARPGRAPETMRKAP